MIFVKDSMYFSMDGFEAPKYEARQLMATQMAKELRGFGKWAELWEMMAKHPGNVVGNDDWTLDDCSFWYVSG